MKFIKNKIRKSYIIEKEFFKDQRGVFFRDYCKKIFKERKISFDIKQSSIVVNKDKYTLRGFHYQKGKSKEKKIMTCIKGKGLIYIVNLDKKSNHFLKPLKFILSEKNKRSLLIPEKCANAYMTLEKNTSFLYYMSNYYNEKQSLGFRYNDPILKIKWPSSPKKISKKDLNFKDIIIT